MRDDDYMGLVFRGRRMIDRTGKPHLFLIDGRWRVITARVDVDVPYALVVSAHRWQRRVNPPLPGHAPVPRVPGHREFA